jgi:osmotically-inducible protein OsmY
MFYNKKNLIFLILLFSLLQVACTAPFILGGPTSIADRRNIEVQYIDQRIEWGASVDLQKMDDEFKANVVSFNQKVLLTGQAKTQEIIDKILSTVKQVKNIEKIYNKMTVGEQNGIKGYANDTAITTNVISRVFSNEGEGKLFALHLKVYTERKIVYLMGILSESEAQQAIKIAQTSKGVLKVVPLFEKSGNNINNK